MIIYFLAALMKRGSTSARDAVEHGAGRVKRSTVLSTMTRLQGNAWLPQRIIMISVAGKNLDSAKKIIVLGRTMDIVRKDGSNVNYRISENLKVKN